MNADAPIADAEARQIPGRETDDRLLDGRVRLRQATSGYRVGIDPVLLAAAVPAVSGDRVLELGLGAGAAALCLAVRVPDCAITGMEVDDGVARLARANIDDNGCAARVEVISGDVTHPPAALGTGFDHVMANPPYLPAARADRRRPVDPARTETTAPLAAWISLAVARTRAKGTVTFIHRSDRLDDLMAALHPLAGGIVVFPLWPRAGVPAKRVIVQARPGTGAPLVLAAGLVLHADDGGSTPSADAVIRHGAPLALSP